MIKEILNGEFTKQEVNTTEFVNWNFQTTITELKKSQDVIKWLKHESSI